MSKPTCPECSDDETYSVRQGTSRRTLLSRGPGVYDESGEYHPPIDMNKTITTYHCSNGHTWTESNPVDPKVKEKRKARKEAREQGLLPDDPFQV